MEAAGAAMDAPIGRSRWRSRCATASNSPPTSICPGDGATGPGNRPVDAIRQANRSLRGGGDLLPAARLRVRGPRVRGRGKSEGEWRAFVNDPMRPRCRRMGRGQEWCTGKVGMTGMSYMGWTQWAAAEAPPHLTCMVSTSAAGRWQQEIPYTSWVLPALLRLVGLRGPSPDQRVHGSLNAIDWDEVLRPLPLEAIGEFIDPTGQTWRDMMDHDTFDDFWKAIRFTIVTTYRRALPARDRLVRPRGSARCVPPLRDDDGVVTGRRTQRLIVGPWSHIKCRFPHHSYAEDRVRPGRRAGNGPGAPAVVRLLAQGRAERGDGHGPGRLFETGTNAGASSALAAGWHGREPLSRAPRRRRGRPEAPAARNLAARSATIRRTRPQRRWSRLYPVEDVPLNQDDLRRARTCSSTPAEPLDRGTGRFRLDAPRAVRVQRLRRHRMARQGD